MPSLPRTTSVSWKSRNSEPLIESESTASTAEELRDRTNSKKNIIIKINHVQKADRRRAASSKTSKSSKSSKKRTSKGMKGGNVRFEFNSQRQILGDISIHISSWTQLMAKHHRMSSTNSGSNSMNTMNTMNTMTSVTESGSSGPSMVRQHSVPKIDVKIGWKTVYCVLDRQTIRFWDVPLQRSDGGDDTANTVNAMNSINFENAENAQKAVTVYLSEILTLSKSIRSIDGEKFIVELTVCGLKVLLSFSNIEQREYWHSLLSDYHLNHFVWRSTPLDPQKRTSQRVVNGVHKLLQSQKYEHRHDLDTLHILYIEQILQKIAALNITAILDLVPPECAFMAGRLVRVIMSVKFFFMSVLKSLSGADIPLPSRSLLISYLDSVETVQWASASNEILDFYTDQCYRILFNLSFAFTSNARDEIMKLNEIIEYKHNGPSSSMPSPSATSTNTVSMDAMERRMAEMKFEYESLQRSWKMHRDRLQEYVMAYRDAVAKLKHSYHQRDHLAKKIEALQRDKQNLTHSLSASRSLPPIHSLNGIPSRPRNYGQFDYAVGPPPPQPPPQHANYGAYGPPPFGAFSQRPPGVESANIEGNGPPITTKSETVGGGPVSTVQHYFSYLKSLHQQWEEMNAKDPNNPQLMSIQKEIEDCRLRIQSLQQNNGGNVDIPEMGTVFGRQPSTGYSWL